MSKTETQSEALHSAWEMELLAADSSLGHRMDLRRDFCRTAARNLRRLDARVNSLEFAFNEWHAKTDWVQATAQALELGMHRADVLRARIEALDAQNKTLIEVLETVDMDMVGVGMGENAISDSARYKVEDVLKQVRAAQAAAKAPKEQA